MGATEALGHLGITAETHTLGIPPSPTPRFFPGHPFPWIYLEGCSAWRAAWRVGLAQRDLETKEKVWTWIHAPRPWNSGDLPPHPHTRLWVWILLQNRGILVFHIHTPSGAGCKENKRCGSVPRKIISWDFPRGCAVSPARFYGAFPKYLGSSQHFLSLEVGSNLTPP